MALLHPRATLHPSKLELLAPWLPTRAWYRGPAGAELTRVAWYRFDDPDGEVGLETLLVRAGDGPPHQIPLSYRGAPLDGRDEWLIGTSDHSVLGPRWIYDACGDPLYARVVAGAIVTGASGAEEFADIDGRLERREPSMTVRGGGPPPGAEPPPPVGEILRVEDGDPTLVVTDSVRLAVRRVLDGEAAPGPGALTGTWRGGPAVILVEIRS